MRTTGLLLVTALFLLVPHVEANHNWGHNIERELQDARDELPSSTPMGPPPCFGLWTNADPNLLGLIAQDDDNGDYGIAVVWGFELPIFGWESMGYHTDAGCDG